MLDLVEDHTLSPEELAGIAVPAGPRRMEDIEAPFKSDGRFAGLAIEHLEILTVPDPIWTAYQSSGAVSQLGLDHANSVRAWSGPSIAECLAERVDRSVVVDKIFDRLAVHLSSDPRPHEPYLAVVVLRKI